MIHIDNIIARTHYLSRPNSKYSINSGTPAIDFKRPFPQALRTADLTHHRQAATPLSSH